MSHQPYAIPPESPDYAAESIDDALTEACRRSPWGEHPCRNVACPYEVPNAGDECAACHAEKWGDES